MLTHATFAPLGNERPRARNRLLPLPISDRIAQRLRIVAGVWGTLVPALFFVMAYRGGIPRSPTPSDWQTYAQLALLVAVALGGLIAWWREGVGASVITAGAIGLGVLAAMEHEPVRAFGVAMAFYVPGLLFWLDWQRKHSSRTIALLATAMIVLLTAGGFGAHRVYATYFGPVQPESGLVAQPVETVEWIWSGATTTDSVTVKAKVTRDSASVRLAVSAHQTMADPVYVSPSSVDPTARIVAFDVTGLNPASEYWYAVEKRGRLDLSRQGRVKTVASGPFSYTFAFGSCASEGSNGAVFDAIRETDPLFFLASGDFFYANIAVNDPQRFRTAFDHNLSAPAQAALYRNVPIAYVWDDHDFGPNNADGTSPSREAAGAVYREVVPHYPLASVGDQGAIFQAFSIGRVRFILTDTRSARSPIAATDDANKTMLGAEQKAWFKQELLAANGRYPVIVWVSTDPWIVPAAEGTHGWGAYSTERREIADFIAGRHIEGLVMLAGDAHMLAIDDGTNSDYSTLGGAGFPVFHAAALDRRGSLKGGPYSEGAYPGGGQFGVMTVNDDGGPTVEIVWSGRNWKGEEIVGHRFTVAALPTGVERLSSDDRDRS